MRVERIRLEHHRDVALPRSDVVDDPLADEDPPLGHVLEPGEHPQRSRLPAAGRTDEDEEFPVDDVDVQVVDGSRLVEAFRHVLVRDRGHQAASSRVGEGRTKCAVARNVYATVNVRKGMISGGETGEVDEKQREPEHERRTGPRGDEA